MIIISALCAKLLRSALHAMWQSANTKHFHWWISKICSGTFIKFGSKIYLKRPVSVNSFYQKYVHDHFRAKSLYAIPSHKTETWNWKKWQEPIGPFFESGANLLSFKLDWWILYYCHCTNHVLILDIQTDKIYIDHDSRKWRSIRIYIALVFLKNPANRKWTVHTY